jgi:site-specific DNA recombinase
VHALDCLSRDAAHLAILYDEAQRDGCQYVSVTEKIQDTPKGKLMRSVRGFVAEVERIKIIERTRRGIQKLVYDNKVVCAGFARFGYKYDPEKCVPVIEPVAAAIVKRMFTLASGGQSLRSIATLFNHENVPTSYELQGRGRRARGWSEATTRKLIRDKSYYGEPFRWKGKPLGGPTPIIVDRATWGRAQLTIKRHKTYSGSLSELRRFRMLAGMVYCGCACRMTPNKVCVSRARGVYADYHVCINNKSKRFACREPRQRIDHVEQVVRDKVQALVQDPETLRRVIERARGSESQAKVQLEAQQESRREAEATISRLIDRLGRIFPHLRWVPCSRSWQIWAGNVRLIERGLVSWRAEWRRRVEQVWVYSRSWSSVGLDWPVL